MYFERLSGTSKLVPFPILTNLVLVSAASEAAFFKRSMRRKRLVIQSVWTQAH
jgi:hypothetical protein